MTARQIASLFIKLVACYVLIKAIPALLSAGGSIAGFSQVGLSQAMPIVVVTVLSVVGLLALMIFIIARSEWFAARLVKADDGEVSVSGLTSTDIQSIAFSWVGLLLITNGVSGLVYQLAYLRRLSAMVGAESGRVAYGDKIYSAITSDSATLGIGILLFLFPRGLSVLWHKIQQSRPMKS